jgi:uncharacterized protein YqhQ
MKFSERSLAFGGQAIIEGVMLRSPTHKVISIRKKDGMILTMTEEVHSFSEKHGFFRQPFIRGIPAFIDTLNIGFTSLFYSANIALEAENESISSKEIGFTIAMIIAVSAFFIVAPFFLLTFFPISEWLFNLIEGGVRLTIFLFFLKLVSLWSEYKRILQYHGAEHKVINAFESKTPITLRNVKQCSRKHPRCGTSCVFVIMAVSILVFSLLPNPTIGIRIAYRIAFIPVIGAISYEIIRLSGKYRTSQILKILVYPGLALQHLTTKEPTDDMIMVAINAIHEVNKLAQFSTVIGRVSNSSE